MICLRSVRARLPLAAKSFTAAAAVLLAASVSPSSRAADSMLPGTLDTSYAPVINKVSLYAVAVDSEGRVAYGGDNHTFTRTLSNGKIDSGFSFSEFGETNRIVLGLAIDRIDRIYTVGAFDPSNDNRKSVNITRFFSDGSRINRGFDAGKGANNSIVTVLLQPTDAIPDNDRVIVGGLFTTFDGSTRGRIARLFSTGNLDDGFDASLNFDGNVYALALQRDAATGASNGQIVVAGAFGKVDGSSHPRLARINFDGSVDSSFAPTVDNDIFAVDVQPDGKIVIGGQFASVNGNRANGLARLNVDGSFDSTFSAAISQDENQGMPTTAVYALRLQSDGRVIVTGSFLKINGVDRRFIGRLNADGSVDLDFDPSGIIANSGEALAIQPDNKIVVGEVVSKKVNGRYPNVLKRLYGNPVPPPLASVSMFGLSTAVEGGQKGVFRIYRDSVDLSSPLTVYYQTLTNGIRPKPGVDYEALPGVLTIPAGETSGKIRVKPLSSTLELNGERLKLKIQPNGGYNVLDSGTGSIRFEDGPVD